MGLGRSMTWALGAILVATGLAMLLFWSGIANWIPSTILGAGLIAIVGLIVMGMANRADKGGPGGTTVVKEESGSSSPDVVKVE